MTALVSEPELSIDWKMIYALLFLGKHIKVSTIIVISVNPILCQIFSNSFYDGGLWSTFLKNKTEDPSVQAAG